MPKDHSLTCPFELDWLNIYCLYPLRNKHTNEIYSKYILNLLKRIDLKVVWFDEDGISEQFLRQGAI